ncbi:acyl carrier protein [Streptomyces brasiliensis]|uniref:Carrier domain-containing protein n=1 Tax=Streptomyces brasiliensis TaxID=1954 RepID=A0A917P336_9ACTN|nr:acyl carrier protein [Streptomyces brasiliensis]GGJ51286.1 hypothetical protein GCM10010121_072710 [Streptomyces brasiliensis]
MTAAAPSPGHPFPQVPAAEVLTGLTALLAGFVAAGAPAADAGQSFARLGLDAVRSAGFVDALNTRFGTSVSPDALDRYPTPKALAGHLAAELAAAAPEPAPGAAPGDERAVLERLRGQLARIVGCAPHEIDTEAPFVLLGLDSILSAQFVEGVNRTWKLREPAGLLYDHPDLASLAAFIAAGIGAAGAAPAGPVTRPAPAAGAGPVTRSAPAGDVDLEALLDAVRDDLLSVDEAAALLGTPRPA